MVVRTEVEQQLVTARQHLAWVMALSQLVVLALRSGVPDSLIEDALEDAAQLRVCPECRAIFTRVRKQLYCSRHCANRVAMRRFEIKQTELFREAPKYDAMRKRGRRS